MKRRAFLSIAAGSCTALAAATRPRYGGVLRVQLAGPMPQLEAPSSNATMRELALQHLVADCLTSINVRGEAVPALASSWQSEAGGKRWRFVLRTGVLLHDGTPLTPAFAAEALKGVHGFDVVPYARGVQVSTTQPMVDLPVMMGLPAASIARTGAFQLNQGPGKAILSAFEDHWAGRPFLDSVELLPPRSGPHAAADVWELPVGSPQRVPDGLSTWSSSPVELLALDTSATDPTTASAIAMSTDRPVLASVFTQRRAHAAASILPQWISGYAFAFSTQRDVTGAQRLVAGLRLPPMGVSHEAGDTLARVVGERIAVNVRDAGIVLSSRAGVSPRLSVRRIPLCANPACSLRTVAASIGLPDHVRLDAPSDPDLLYGTEKILIESGRLVPLLHVPLVYGVRVGIQGFSTEAYVPAALPLASVWIRP